MVDWYTKTVLSVIAVALVWNAIGAVLKVPAHAEGPLPVSVVSIPALGPSIQFFPVRIVGVDGVVPVRSVPN